MTFPVREDGESELTPASLSQLYTHFRRKVHLKYIVYYQDLALNWYYTIQYHDADHTLTVESKLPEAI
jgi:hypothetical protein